MPRKPATKVAPPDESRCEMQDKNASRCKRLCTFRLVREDGTEQRLCRPCAYKLRDQMQHRPSYFGHVHFTYVNSDWAMPPRPKY